MSTTDLRSVCDELTNRYSEKYDLSVHLDGEEIVVYLPLDESNEPDPPESKASVEEFFASRGFSTTMEGAGLLVAEPQIT